MHTALEPAMAAKLLAAIAVLVLSEYMLADGLI